MQPADVMLAHSDPFFGGLGRALIGGATGFLTGGPAGAIIGAAGGLTGGGTGAAPPSAPAIQQTPGLSVVPGQIVGQGSIKRFAAPAGCSPGFVLNPANGVCEAIGSPGDVSTGTVTSFGRAVMGRYGVALEPAAIPSVRLRCPRGSVLGTDNLCYDSLPKLNRKWRPGTKPLLTGGERNAIRTATRVAGKLARTQKSLKATSRALAKVC